MNSKKKTKKVGEPSSATLAVALQDHLLQNLSLGSPFSSHTRRGNSVYNQMKKSERQRMKSLKNIKSTVNTGLCRSPKQNKVKAEEQEFVLGPKPQPPSLAQKLGIVPLSRDQKQLLTETEWKDLKRVTIERESFKNPCVICKDSFRLEDQVLLSCSHVFHRACLQAFERFSGRKTCPMCRHDNYQTRVVFEGSKYYKIKSAIRIQACWRGYVVRKWYVKLRETLPPSDPKLRRKFYQNKLSQITDRYVSMTSSDTVDRFLNEIDRSVEESRQIFEHFEINGLNQLSDEDWVEVEDKAISRGATDCSICLQNFNETSSHTIEKCSRKSRCEQGESTNSVVLLSCSHLFHSSCLTALEQFAGKLPEFQRRSTRTSCIFKCPVCRSFYKKRLITLK